MADGQEGAPSNAVETPRESDVIVDDAIAGTSRESEILEEKRRRAEAIYQRRVAELQKRTRLVVVAQENYYAAKRRGEALNRPARRYAKRLWQFWTFVLGIVKAYQYRIYCNFMELVAEPQDQSYQLLRAALHRWTEMRARAERNLFAAFHQFDARGPLRRRPGAFEVGYARGRIEAPAEEEGAGHAEGE